MSAMLLGLAFKARVPTPAAKLVLLKLVDCCDDKGERIFPSVGLMAEAAMCSHRQVQRVLRLFCSAGLLRVVREGGGRPGATTHYALNLDVLTRLAGEGWAAIWSAVPGSETAADAPAEETENAANVMGDTMSPMTLETERGDMMCHPTPQENPSVMRESAGGCAEGRSTASAAPGMDGGLKAFLAAWPTAAVDDQARIGSAWAELTTEQRRAAQAGIAPFLAELKAAGRKAVPAGWKYLSERRWTLLAEKTAAKAATGVFAAEAWSREWWAVVINRVAAGQPVRIALAAALEGKGSTFAGAERPDEERLAGLLAYPSTGAEMAAWRPWFAARGAPFPVFRTLFWVYLPSPEPPSATVPEPA